MTQNVEEGPSLSHGGPKGMWCYCILHSFAALRPSILGRFSRGSSSSGDTKKEKQVTGENLAWELGRRDAGVFALEGV